MPKPKLKVLSGGGRKPKRELPVSMRPTVGLVSDVTPTRGFRARDYLTDQEDKTMPERFRGRSRVYPEVKLLQAAKAWYRAQVEHARDAGYQNMRAFAREQLTTEEEVLFARVKALLTWEKT